MSLTIASGLGRLLTRQLYSALSSAVTGWKWRANVSGSNVMRCLCSHTVVLSPMYSTSFTCDRHSNICTKDSSVTPGQGRVTLDPASESTVFNGIAVTSVKKRNTFCNGNGHIFRKQEQNANNRHKTVNMRRHKQLTGTYFSWCRTQECFNKKIPAGKLLGKRALEIGEWNRMITLIWLFGKLVLR